MEKSGQNKKVQQLNVSHSSQNWQSVQVNHKDMGHCLFQVQDGGNQCRWMDSNGQLNNAAPVSTVRAQFAIANLDDKFIFVLGGRTAERFDIERGVWESLPSMVQNRLGASACAMNGTVYVFFGQDENQEPISTIEKLENAGGPARGSRFSIVPTSKTIMGRWFAAVASINSREIAIMGGIGVVDDEDSCLGDCYVFNTETGMVDQKIQNFPGLLQFQSQGNKAQKIDEDVVVALVQKDFDGEDTRTTVIEWNKNSKMIKQLQQL